MMTEVRIIGNFLLMAGYPILLYLHPILGATIKTIGPDCLTQVAESIEVWLKRRKGSVFMGS